MATHQDIRTVSAAGAARLLGFSKQLTLRLIHEGRLPAKTLDGRIRVRPVDCEKFIKALAPTWVNGDPGYLKSRQYRMTR